MKSVFLILNSPSLAGTFETVVVLDALEAILNVICPVTTSKAVNSAVSLLDGGSYYTVHLSA